jgi:hypothetical protein
MHRAPCRQSGAILIMTVIFLIVLLGFAALALDFGRLYVLRSQMQNAADAAALAAAYELDGQLGARERAVKAATHVLEHKGYFSEHQELLAQLEGYWRPNDTEDPQTNPFVFYSWIGSESDNIDPPDGCEPADEPDPGKCITTDDDVAAYIKVQLDPAITTGEENDYGIKFILAPVLGLFTDDILTEGFTKVMAVAGNTDSAICNMPPIMMCTPETALTIGQEVRFVSQHATQWLPGDFGFLVPFECAKTDDACHEPQLNKALGSQMAQERTDLCSPPNVRLLPGNRQPTDYSTNTRYGLYGKEVGVIYDDDLPAENPQTAAPNIIDYPGDTILLNDATDDLHFGDGVWDAADYFSRYHSAETLPSNYANYTRFQTYYWELTGNAADEDSDHDGIPDIYTSFWENEPVTLAGHFPLWSDGSIHQCMQPPVTGNDPDAWDKSNTCENIDGDPVTHPEYNDDPPTIPGITEPFEDLEAREPPPGDTEINTGLANRRVLFVAELDCTDPNFPDKTSPQNPINVFQHGRFIKFFLTRHVRPNDNPNTLANETSTIYAEYLGPATMREEDEILIHNVIQLYE